MEALIRDADAVSTAGGSSQVRSGLEAWFTLPDRPAPMHPPPKWKMALVTWVALRPMVIGLSYALAPLRLPFLVTAAVSTAIPVVMLTWVIMPRRHGRCTHGCTVAERRLPISMGESPLRIQFFRSL